MVQNRKTSSLDFRFLDLDIEAEVLVKELSKFLENNSPTVDLDKNLVEISGEIEELPFQWKFELSTGSSDKFTKTFLGPIVRALMITNEQKARINKKLERITFL